MSPVDITTGFADNTRGLSIENVVDGEEVKAVISQELAAGEGMIEFSDGVGQECLINTDKVTYVHTGDNVDYKAGLFAQ